jgi:hypothetical protein
MPFTGSTDQVVQYEIYEAVGMHKYPVTKSVTMDCIKSLEDTHNVDLIINDHNIPPGALMNIKDSQGYFDFIPKDRSPHGTYRLVF